MSIISEEFCWTISLQFEDDIEIDCIFAFKKL